MNKLKTSLARRVDQLSELLGVGAAFSLGLLLLLGGGIAFGLYRFVDPAPPQVITLLGGPEDSSFERNAERYREILARNGVKLEIVRTQGSLENLVHLSDLQSKADIGFVQTGLIKSGLAQGLDIQNLVSLGSISYQPLFVFYRGRLPVDRLTDLAGKRLCIGPPGSGTRVLATELLKANAMEEDGETTQLDLIPEEAAEALLANKADAIFLMGDSAPIKLIRQLMETPGIRLMSFSQADAYTRRIDYLNKVTVPQGGLDLGRDIPAQDVELVAPTVELVARSDLHPALSDLLLEAAREVHGKATLFQKRGEFPVAQEHEYRISDDAARYYTSGKSFLYKHLPFWLATLVGRAAMVIVPLMVVLIPVFRILPAVYSWHIKLRISKWYGVLLDLERSLLGPVDDQKRMELLVRLDEIERSVNRMKIPVTFGDQFYVLRQHIIFVRDRLRSAVPPDVVRP